MVCVVVVDGGVKAKRIRKTLNICSLIFILKRKKGYHIMSQSLHALLSNLLRFTNFVKKDWKLCCHEKFGFDVYFCWASQVFLNLCFHLCSIFLL